MARLENWTIINQKDSSGNSYIRLSGSVYGHPRADFVTTDLCDGNSVVTSKIINLDLNEMIAISQSGTVYYLGSKNN